jgi:hypothetical protein
MATVVSSTNAFADKTCAYGPKPAALPLFANLSSEQYHKTNNSFGHIDEVGAHNINEGVALTKSLLYKAGLESSIGVSRLHKHFDIAMHEVVVSEISPCRSKMTSSVKNIIDIGSEHVPMTWAYRQGAWHRVQLLLLPDDRTEDGGISDKLRNDAADCEAQLLRLIDGSAGIDAAAAWAEYVTGPGGGIASQVGVSLRFVDLIKGFEPSVNMMLETTDDATREQVVQVVDNIASSALGGQMVETHWFKGSTVNYSAGCYVRCSIHNTRCYHGGGGGCGGGGGDGG